MAEGTAEDDDPAGYFGLTLLSEINAISRLARRHSV